MNYMETVKILLLTAFSLCVLINVTFTLIAPWWKSFEGRALFGLVLVLGTTLGWLAFTLIHPLTMDVRRVLGLLTYIFLNVALLYLFIVIIVRQASEKKLLRIRRAQEALDRENPVPEQRSPLH
jgi:hypothetical protein